MTTIIFTPYNISMNSITIGSPSGDPVTTTTADQVAFSPTFTSLSLPGLASFPSGAVVTPLAANSSGVVMLNSSTETAENKLTTEGQLLSVASNGTLTAIDIGAPGQVLMVSGGLPAWENDTTSTILTTEGQLLTVNASSELTALDIGTTGQVLTVSDGLPSWQPTSTTTMTTEGDLLTVNATGSLTAVSIGTTGQVLTVSGGLPAWESVPLATSTYWSPSITNSDMSSIQSNASYVLETDVSSYNAYDVGCQVTSVVSTSATSYTFAITGWPNSSAAFSVSTAIITGTINSPSSGNIYCAVDNSSSDNLINATLVFASAPATSTQITFSIRAVYTSTGGSSG